MTLCWSVKLQLLYFKYTNTNVSTNIIQADSFKIISGIGIQ